MEKTSEKEDPSPSEAESTQSSRPGNGDAKKLEEILSREPDSLETRYELALIYETRHLDYHRALREYRNITANHPEEIRAWFGLGILSYLLCNDRSAKEAFEKVIELNPGYSSTAWIYRARLSKDPLVALEYLEKGLQLNRDLPEALETLADTYFSLERFPEALSALDRYLIQHPGEASILNKKARVLIRLGQYSFANEILEARTKDQQNRDYKIASAELFRKEGRYDEARASLQDALNLDERDREAYRVLAELEMERENLDGALEALDRFLSKFPSDPWAIRNRGRLLFQKKAFRESLESFQELLVIDNTMDQELLSIKAELHFNLKEYDRSLQTLEKLLDAFPENARGWFQKGLTLDHLSRTELARGAYENALNLNPEFGGAWNNLGYDYYLLKDYKSAVDCYTKAIEIKNDFAAAWYNRSCSFSLKGQRAESLNDLAVAIKLNGRYKTMAPDDPDYESLKSDPDFQMLTTDSGANPDGDAFDAKD